MNTRPLLTLPSSANKSNTAPSLKTKDVVTPSISKIVSPVTPDGKNPPSLKTKDVVTPSIPKNVSSAKTTSKPNSSNFKDNKEASKPSLSKKELRSLQIQAAVEKRIAAYNEHFKIFSKQYPKCFLTQPRPVAIGIDKLLFAEQEGKPVEERSSKRNIRQFLFWYTASKEYKEALKVDASRIDLQGNEVEKVTLEQLNPALKSPL
jgi:hypothetical protein